jgi:Holliday junction resolvasome RuvABC endonuclease subunit
MTIVVGVDPAAARLDAVVLYPDGSFVLHTRKSMPSGIVERCVVAQRWLESIVKTYLREDDVVVGIEEPGFGLQGRAHGAGMIPVTKICGALVAGSVRAGASLTLEVNNKRWKKRIVGNGNAKKPEISAWVRRYWRSLYRAANGRQDACDAACIALEVQEVIRLRRKMEATRRRAALRKD